MGKKIEREEFLKMADRMRFVSDSYFTQVCSELWARIQEVQSSESMSREEFLDAMDKALGKGRRTFTDKELDAICALTAQQGFTPDCGKTDRQYFVGYFTNETWIVEQSIGEFVMKRPAPKMMPKDVSQLCREWVEDQWHQSETPEDSAWADLAVKLANGETIQGLCEKANIPLETTDE